jgi:hypothetical protein
MLLPALGSVLQPLARSAATSHPCFTCELHVFGGVLSSYHRRVDRERLMKEGGAAFNRGDFYDAHEFWEEVWNEVDDPDRRWIQGMIQIATALHHVGRERLASARTLLHKALDKLVDAPPALDGWQLHRLRDDARAILRALDGGERPAPFRIHAA